MRDKRWKLIEDRRAGTFELYDLEADPHEDHDRLALPWDESGQSEEANEAKARLLALFPKFE